MLLFLLFTLLSRANQLATPLRRVFGRANPQPLAEPAVISVAETVIAANPERFGANLEIFDYEPWLLNSALLNNWVADGGMEPIILRYKGVATGGSALTIENSNVVLGLAAGDGFFDGAEVRIYRIINGVVHLLRTGVAIYYAESAATGVLIDLDAPGPAIAAGDIYFLALLRADSVVAETSPLATVAKADTWRVYPNGGDNRAIKKQRDVSTVAPEHNSRASMRVDIDAAIEGGLIQFVTGSPQDQSVNSFKPGRVYRVELWLKQRDVADGKVRVWLFPYRGKPGQTFSVSGEWSRYYFTFRGPRRMLRSGLAQLNITFNGPGTVWIDNVRVFDQTAAPYAVNKRALAAFRDFHPGTLRIWSGQTNTAWGTTLDNWIAPEGQGMRQWEPRRGVAPGALFSLPTALDFARASAAAPWLIVHPSFDEMEWRNLIEYLAGPATTPYGQVRAASGQNRPWTDEFDRVRIEFGNETWNNLFAPWTFASGAQYGQFAEYFFRIAKSSPYYAVVADKLEFILGGWTLSTGPGAYGVRARQASASSAMIALSSYLAGWDVEQIPAATMDERFQNTLLYAPWIMRSLTDRQVGMRNLLSKTGSPVVLATSEGGSDYSLPKPHQPLDGEQELFGKSLAAGVCTLDAFLYQAANGYGPQAFHTFGVGPRWTSHTTLASGFRPHPAWLALQMRNRYATGEMLATKVAGGPRIDLPPIQNIRYRIPAQNGLPLIASYAFRRHNRFAVFVISRHLTLATPVTLRLPAPPLNATLYTLSGDPRANNIQAMAIKLRRHKISGFGAEHKFVMPPGSIYLFVVDTAPDQSS